LKVSMIMHIYNRREFLKTTGQVTLTSMIPWIKQSSVLPSTKENVSLDEMIGQMLLVGFRGLEVHEGDTILQDVRERHLGGIVLFDYDGITRTYVRNIQSPQQVKKLINDLQAAASTPLLISIDHEGGTVCRLKEQYGFPPTVSAATMGRRNDLDFTYRMAITMAETLAGLGINLNLAPVVDVNINPENPIIGKRERSFHSDPERVTAHALEFINAHHEKGVFCTMKHFPGHGSSTKDSHHGLVDVTDTWSEAELQPYAEIIDRGEADVIMTAHVFNRHIDAQFPATLSRATLTGILRERLNFDGVIMSDDMLMGAIIQEYDLPTAIQLAIQAGIDILAIANNAYYKEGVTSRVIQLVKQMIIENKISENRIRESYRRIQKLKSKRIDFRRIFEMIPLFQLNKLF
jgi:beta-N-acetylhexosaminidase